MQVPFFRPDISEDAIGEVADTLRSGWLTTGPRVQRFEINFATAVSARYAVAVNSCTAALHLATEALGLKAGQAVLVPTMTFAATAEVVRYARAVPILVDCEPDTLNLSLEDADAKLAALREGQIWSGNERSPKPVCIIPVHVGGVMGDAAQVRAFARRHHLWVVEDAAHAFPAAWRRSSQANWQRCGQGSADVSCFSFYANKTITTGEGGMAVTDDKAIADRIRLMSLHGLSKDAWGRYADNGSWDYQLVEPGFKYNMTDIAAAIGIHQLKQAEEMRLDREHLAREYLNAFAAVEELKLPPVPKNRLHAWHLFPIRLRLDRLTIDRNCFVEELKKAGVGFSVHWRPLHLHPYYRKCGWRPEQFPVATRVWLQLVSLPLFPAMTDVELKHVIRVVKELCRKFRKQRVVTGRVGVISKQ